jgi:hypothetical protein
MTLIVLGTEYNLLAEKMFLADVAALALCFFHHSRAQCAMQLLLHSTFQHIDV